MNLQLIKNTVALVISNIIVRIIGLIYKVWLAQTITPEALGYYQLSLSVYMLFMSLPSSGLPGAISRHYSATTSTERKSQILYEGVRLGLILSVVSGSLMLLFAPTFAWLLLKDIASFSVFIVLVPAIIFGGAASVPYGYLHASSRSTLVAISEIIEQLGKVIAVFVIFYLFNTVPSLAQTSIAAAGISIGGVISFILIMLFIGKIHKNKNASIRKELIKTATPLTANRFITSFLGMITASLVPLRMMVFGLESQEAFSLYGIINGMAMPIIMLPSTLISALCVTLLPRFSAINASGDVSALYKRIKKVLMLVICLCCIFATALALLSYPIGDILYSNTQASTFIRYLSPYCIFIGINQLCSTILTSLGHEYKTFKIHITVSLIALIGSFFFTSIWGAEGYVLSMILQSSIGSILFLSTTIRCVKKRLPNTEKKCIVSSQICRVDGER